MRKYYAAKQAKYWVSINILGGVELSDVYRLILSLFYAIFLEACLQATPAVMVLISALCSWIINILVSD